MGSGLFLDHGTGIVIGETAVVGDEVSMLHAVTLGGTGAERGDRHPKIGKGVLLGAGAKVLGNITIGDYAKVASGSVVLKPVPAGCTVAGVPARLVNCPTEATPGADDGSYAGRHRLRLRDLISRHPGASRSEEPGTQGDTATSDAALDVEPGRLGPGFCFAAPG
jgi:serine acetyltransferase